MMGSYCGINFDKISVCDSKSYVPDDWAALFQEGDRRVATNVVSTVDENEHSPPIVEYAATRAVIIRRLELLGVTTEVTRCVFHEWLAQERDTWQQHKNGWAGEFEGGKYADAILHGLDKLDYNGWCHLAAEALKTRYDFANYEARAHELEKDPFKKQFYEMQDNYLWFSGYGSHINLRALLDASVTTEMVRLDISDLVDEYVGADEPVCTLARESAPQQIQTLAPTMVMAEGSTDIFALRIALEVMHPELVDYFSFFNHAELSVDGGAGYLVKFLKAIATARSASRILAIFDNDTVGIQAFEQAKALALPHNIIVTHYPDSAIAKSYPTVGPGGW